MANSTLASTAGSFVLGAATAGLAISRVQRYTAATECSSRESSKTIEASFERELARAPELQLQAQSHANDSGTAAWPLTREDEVALVDTELRALVRAGALDVPRLDASDGDASHVQPATIDLPVGGAGTGVSGDAEYDRVFVMKRKVLPMGRRLGSLLEGRAGVDRGSTETGLVLEERSLAGSGCVLLKGQTYIVRCGDLQLPREHWGRLSPKSSIGRVDLMVRAVVDGCGLYDQVPADGKKRTLWLELTPQSFNVRLRRGVALTQLMVLRRRRGKELPSAFDPTTGITWGGGGTEPSNGSRLHKRVITDTDACALDTDSHTKAALGATEGYVVFDEQGHPKPLLPKLATPDANGCADADPDASAGASIGCGSAETAQENEEAAAVGCTGGQLHNGAIVLSLSVPGFLAGAATVPLIGYEALPTNEVVDLAKPGAHAAEDFFRPIHACSRRPYLTLEKDHFYILCTKERVSIPNALSAEMVPFSHNVGELRVHYAGFFDPGFGYGRSGEVRGTIGVLEVRPHETISIYDGQPICLMEFFRNSTCPEKPYGFTGNNNYARQSGPKLAKYFAMG